MKNDDGALSFGTAIDMSGFDAGIEQIEGKVAGLTSNVEVETSKISQLLANVPTYLCERDEDRAYVLDHLDELVVKLTHSLGDGGLTTRMELETRREADK